MLKEWEKQVSVDSHQVWKWLKTDCLHRRAARRLLRVNPHTVQHARTRAVTSYAGESTFVVLKTTTVAAEVKAEAPWELLWPQLLRIDTDVSTGQASPRLYVTLTPTVREQHETWTTANVEICEKSVTGVNEKHFLFMKVWCLCRRQIHL